MLFQVKITQSSKTQTCFYSVAQIKSNSENEIKDIAQKIGFYLKDFIKLQTELEQMKLKIGQSIKKSLPLDIEIKALDENEDFYISLTYKNFGKFASEASQAEIERSIELQCNFVATHYDFMGK